MSNRHSTVTHPTETPKYFFQGIDIRRFLIIALSLGLVVGLIETLSDMNIQRNRLFPVFEFLRQYSLYSSCCLLGLILAEKASLQNFLVLRKQSQGWKVVLLLLFGILPGVLMGISYHLLFAQYRFSRHVPIWIRRLETEYDTFLFSLRAALSEEVVFRFLLFTAFYYILKRLFWPVIEGGFGMARWIPLLFSVIFSSLLFGVAHGTYGFMTAFLAGIVLCLAFFKGGLESAVLAHFLANFLFFNWTYLN